MFRKITLLGLGTLTRFVYHFKQTLEAHSRQLKSRFITL